MILITGATSQVGILLVNKLFDEGYRVRCIVRKTSNTSSLHNQAELFVGDVEDEEALEQALKDVEYVVHIAGIWRVHSLLKVCKKSKTFKKAIFIGSTSRFKKLGSIDEQERLLAEKMAEAEAIIQRSGVNSVILRPTMIYGIDSDKNILQIISFMKKYHFYPVIGKGDSLKNPVYVGDVAAAILQCMTNESVNGKDYIISGKQPVRYKNMLKLIKAALPGWAFLLHVPAFAGYLAVFAYRLLRRNTYINYAMVKRINEDVTYDITNAVKDFGYGPLSFDEGIKMQVEYLKKKNFF